MNSSTFLIVKTTRLPKRELIKQNVPLVAVLHTRRPSAPAPHALNWSVKIATTIILQNKMASRSVVFAANLFKSHTK